MDSPFSIKTLLGHRREDLRGRWESKLYADSILRAIYLIVYGNLDVAQGSRDGRRYDFDTDEGGRRVYRGKY